MGLALECSIVLAAGSRENSEYKSIRVAAELLRKYPGHRIPPAGLPGLALAAFSAVDISLNSHN